MRLTHARAAVGAMAAAVALLATACGGGADRTRSEAGGETGGTPVSGVAAGAATDSSAPTDRPSAGAGRFCDVVHSETAKLKPLVPRPGAAPTPAQLRAFYAAALTADNRTAEAAPPEIKADADTSAQKAAAFATVLERANYDVSKVPPDAGTNDDDGSVARVDAYVKRVCGFDRTTG